MFKSEGNFNVTIVAALAADAKFCHNDPNAFDVCLKVDDGNGQTDWWRGEVSSRQGQGRYANWTQSQITMEMLGRIGLQNGDLSQLPNLVGTQITATTKASTSTTNGRTYYNVRYIGCIEAPQALDAMEFQRRLQGMTG